MGEYSFADQPSFRRAQSLVQAALCKASGADWPQTQGILQAGMSYDVRVDFELMTQIENCLVDLLVATGRLGDIKSIQFPANVRIVHGAPPSGYLARPFATDYVHCDVWSDAPADSMNAFLYLFTIGNCARLKLFESIALDPYARSFRGPYSDYKGDLSSLKAVPVRAEAGSMYLFDTFSPHKTERTGEGLRISIDFRVRTDSPYMIDGAPADPVKFGRYSPGVPGPGIYWSTPGRTWASFEDKCDFELSNAKAIGPWAVALREAYIGKIKASGVFA
jgi:hypothetical protein